MKLRTLLLLVLVLCLGLLSAAVAGEIKKKPDKTKAPVRVFFSGNMEGELDPCG
jgi:hypothetical protein